MSPLDLLPSRTSDAGRLSPTEPVPSRRARPDALREISPEWRLAILILVLAAISVYAAFWPGIVHWDTAQILTEAHHGPIVDWWTAAGTLGLRVWFDLGLGPAALWVATVAAAVVGLFGCARAVLRPVPAAVAALAMTVFPPVYAQLSTLSRDTGYISFSLLAFAALGAMIRTERPSPSRWLAVALASSVLATISRQNGLIDVVVVVLVAILHGRPVTWKRLAAAGLAAATAAGASYGVVSGAGAAMGARSVHPERVTYVYDLAALSVATNSDLFPERQLRALGPGGAAPTDTSLPTLRRTFRPFNVASLVGVAQMDYADPTLAAREDAILRRAWITAVSRYPAEYLAVRGRLTLSLLGLGNRGPDGSPYGPDFAYEGLENTSNYGHPLRFPAVADRAGVVLGWFLGPHAVIPLDLLWSYFLVGAAAVVVGWRRRSGITLLARCLLAGLALNLMLLFFTAMAAGFRYGNLVPPVVILVVLYTLSSDKPDESPI